MTADFTPRGWEGRERGRRKGWRNKEKERGTQRERERTQDGGV